MVGLGMWALVTVLQAVVTGKVQPFAKGFSYTYEREAQPKRFWASLAWNTLIGGFFLWLAYDTNDDATKQPLRDQCYDENNLYPPRIEIVACSKLIAGQDSSISDLVRTRGFAYYRLGDYRRANSDYNETIRLDPRDSSAYVYRGLIHLDLGGFDQALVDFTRAHELDPKDPWALANRGLAFAWKKDEAHAEKDFRAVRAINPSNPVMLRGEAILRINAGDTPGAVNSLSASLVSDPSNLWALRKRAELYWELGEQEKSAEDDKKWQQLMEKARTSRH